MTNLEELIIHDTKIALAHLPNIFAACQKIVKLSFSLTEKNLDQYQENVMKKASFDELVRGFQQLTHVKIFTLAPSDYPVDFWPVTLGVLKYWKIEKCLLYKWLNNDNIFPLLQMVPQMYRLAHRGGSCNAYHWKSSTC